MNTNTARTFTVTISNEYDSDDLENDVHILLEGIWNHSLNIVSEIEVVEVENNEH